MDNAQSIIVRRDVAEYLRHDRTFDPSAHAEVIEIAATRFNLPARLGRFGIASNGYHIERRVIEETLSEIARHRRDLLRDG